MKTRMKMIAAALVIGLWSLPGLAEEPAAPAASAPQAPATSAPTDAEGSKTISMTIGGGSDAKDSESKPHGITITVDGHDKDNARIQVAGKVVDRVVDDLEKSLQDLPDDVRRDLDADDMHELRQALEEIRELKQGDHDSDDGFNEDLIPGIVAITLLFGGPVLIVALVSYNNRRKRQMVHETIDRIIAQGKDVPVELLDALDKGDKSRRSMLSRGVTNVALGLGIAGVLWGLGGDEAASLGLIWICYGAGQLLVWKLEDKPRQDGTPVS